MSARKYRMTRITSGDYLLPSNDLRTLWRIFRYTEHGDASWVDSDGDEHVIRGEWWACARYERRFHGKLDIVQDPDFFEWGSHWLHWSGPFATRQEAVDEAIRASEKEALHERL